MQCLPFKAGHDEIHLENSQDLESREVGSPEATPVDERTVRDPRKTDVPSRDQHEKRIHLVAVRLGSILCESYHHTAVTRAQIGAPNAFLDVGELRHEICLLGTAWIIECASGKRYENPEDEVANYADNSKENQD